MKSYATKSATKTDNDNREQHKYESILDAIIKLYHMYELVRYLFWPNIFNRSKEYQIKMLKKQETKT